MTSIQRELARPVTLQEASDAATEATADVFSLTPRPVDSTALETRLAALLAATS
jgi:hypothetical protein